MTFKINNILLVLSYKIGTDDKYSFQLLKCIDGGDPTPFVVGCIQGCFRRYAVCRVSMQYATISLYRTQTTKTWITNMYYNNFACACHRLYFYLNFYVIENSKKVVFVVKRYAVRKPN